MIEAVGIHEQLDTPGPLVQTQLHRRDLTIHELMLVWKTYLDLALFLTGHLPTYRERPSWCPSQCRFGRLPLHNLDQIGGDVKRAVNGDIGAIIRKGDRQRGKLESGDLDIRQTSYLDLVRDPAGDDGLALPETRADVHYKASIPKEHLLSIENVHSASAESDSMTSESADRVSVVLSSVIQSSCSLPFSSTSLPDPVSEAPLLAENN
ncbi:hypothetical protein P7C73_g2015, partial [Tremellales sp. Uapishka_1]